MTTEPHSSIPTTAAFGARLALIRWQMGWNQKEAALACRLPQGSWREWELSGRAPRDIVKVAAKVAEATGIDDYWIITGKETPTDGGAAAGLPRYDSNVQPAGHSARHAALTQLLAA